MKISKPIEIAIWMGVILNGTTSVLKFIIFVFSSGTVLVGDNDFFCIGSKRNVCIMRHDDYLPVFLALFNESTEFRIDGLVIQIILWLINKNGAITML